jgi:hypothetical protein
VAKGEVVLDVPAKLAARVRVFSQGHGRKTDRDDAVSIGLAVAFSPVSRPGALGLEGRRRTSAPGTVSPIMVVMALRG